MSSEDTNQELEAENQELRDKVAELEEENVNLTRKNDDLNAENAAYLKELEDIRGEKTKQRKIKDYKVGDFVVVPVPFQVDWENGRVLEKLAGGSAMIVATEKGEVSIGDPARVRKQSDA